MLGQDVMRAAGDRGVGLTHAELDVTDAGAVADALAGATVINCAGLHRRGRRRGGSRTPLTRVNERGRAQRGARRPRA